MEMNVNDYMEQIEDSFTGEDSMPDGARLQLIRTRIATDPSLSDFERFDLDARIGTYLADPDEGLPA